MSINVDFTGVEAVAYDGPGDLIPEGSYLVRVEKAEVGYSQAGNEGIKLRLKVQGGDHDGRVVFDDLWLTEKALGYVRYRLEVMGAKIPDGPFNLDPDHLVGRRARVEVVHETFREKTRAKVAGWSRIEAEPVGNPFEGDLPVEKPAAAAHRDPADDDSIPF